jgi:hypothetical protein
MKRIASISLFLLCSLTLAASASAQDEGGERPGAIGVGVSGMLVTGPGFANQFAGPTVVFQTPVFHIEGMLTFSDNDADGTDMGIGGRFWYALSQTSRSDFSIGGGLALLIDDTPGGDDETDIEINVGAQIRAFIVSNVALSATLGFGVVVTDGDDFVGLIGDITGAAGIVYFF